MRCPECGLEHEAHAKRCARCGVDLTYTALTSGEHHRTTQVWSTDIDTDRNKRNTRAAMIAAAVGVLLTVVLAAILLLWLPRNLSFSLPSLSLPDITISDILDELRRPEQAVPVPEPDMSPAMALDGAVLDFINVFAAYVIELSYVEDAEQQTEIHQMFYPEFEYLLMREYSVDSLYVYEYARWLLEQVRLLSDPDTDRTSGIIAMNELSTITLTLNESYYFLNEERHTLDYFTAMQRYTQALLEVEYDLQAQLWGAGTAYDRDLGCEAVYYTNNTPYTMDVMIYNEFVTEDMHYSDSYGVGWLMPHTRQGIPLYALEEIGAQDHTWRISWEVEALYLDGEPLDPWDIIVDEAIGVWG